MTSKTGSSHHSENEISWNSRNEHFQARDLTEYEKLLAGNEVTHDDVADFFIKSLKNYDPSYDDAPQNVVENRIKWKGEKEYTALRLKEGGFESIKTESGRCDLIELRSLSGGLKGMISIIEHAGESSEGLKSYLEDMEIFIEKAKGEQKG